MSTMTQVEKEFAQSFRDLTDAITVYYHAAGQGDRWGCGRVSRAPFPSEPDYWFGFDFVPEPVRDRLEAMMQKTGITAERGDGLGGKRAYFHFHLKDDGAGTAKMDHLTRVVKKEVETITGKPYEQYAGIAKAMRAIFLATSDKDTPAERLHVLKEVIAGMGDHLPPRTADELVRKIDGMQRETGRS